MTEKLQPKSQANNEKNMHFNKGTREGARTHEANQIARTVKKISKENKR